MTTLTTERLKELLEKLNCLYGLGFIFHVDELDEAAIRRDIIAALTRLIEVESENVRLQAEIDANAWNTSPAMAQATIEQHWERIQRLQAELAAAKETIATLQNQQYGTPCEQIRHAHEVETLRADNERLKGIKPELPPFPSDGSGLPRYGLRWNGPDEPLAVPMDDGYWTPYHLAEKLHAELAAIKAEVGDCPLWPDELAEPEEWKAAIVAYLKFNKHRAEHLAARNVELIKAHEWQPIETAPRDGTRILLYRPPAERTSDDQIDIKRGIPRDNLCWDETVPDGMDASNYTDGACKATHWMPLPSPPAKQEQQS